MPINASREPRPRVLIVDDDILDLKAAARVIVGDMKLDAVVLQATSLREAAETLRVSSVDLVLLDLHLGDSAGIATVRRVHELVPYLPIIALTSVEEPQMGGECIRMGAEDFVPKVSVQQHLARVVTFALRRRRRANQQVLGMLRGLRDSLPPELDAQTVKAVEVEFKRVLSVYGTFVQGPVELPTIRRQIRAVAESLIELGARPSDVLRDVLGCELDVEWPNGEAKTAKSSHFCLELMAAMAEAFHERGNRDAHL